MGHPDLRCGAMQRAAMRLGRMQPSASAGRQAIAVPEPDAISILWSVFLVRARVRACVRQIAWRA